MMQERHAVVSFSYLAVLRGQVDLPNKHIMHIDPLYPVSTGLVRGVNHHLLHKLPQECGGAVQWARCTSSQFSESSGH